MPESTSPEPTSPEAATGLQLSRRQALAMGGGLAAAAAAGSVVSAGPVAAQTAGPTPDPSASPTTDPSATATPTPSPTGVAGQPQTLLSLSLAQAHAIVTAAEQKAVEIGVPMHIVVVDVCGDVKASSRQDRNARAALVLAPLKAQTALAFRTPTAVLAERTTDPVRAQSFLAAGFTLLGGGLPIAGADGQVIGAIGVGGGSPEQDIEVAVAGLAAPA